MIWCWSAEVPIKSLPIHNYIHNLLIHKLHNSQASIEYEDFFLNWNFFSEFWCKCFGKRLCSNLFISNLIRRTVSHWPQRADISGRKKYTFWKCFPKLKIKHFNSLWNNICFTPLLIRHIYKLTYSKSPHPTSPLF